MRNILLSTLLVLSTGPVLAEAMSPGKPGAPVTIEHRLLGRAEPGQPVDVEVIVRATGRMDSMSYTIDAAPALGLGRAESVRRLSKVADGDSERRVLRLQPAVAGVHTITVSVTSQQSGRQRATVRVIEIPVGAGAERAMAAPGRLVEGRERRVVVLPAEETRR